MRILIALALALTAGFAVAADAPKVDVKAAATAADANKDGALSKEEIAGIQDASAKAAVEALDANKDGAVSKEEWAAAK